MPALFTTWSIEPNLSIAVFATSSAVSARLISPSTSARLGDGAYPAFEMLREVATTL
jgi:hypothetical protein